MTIRHFLNLAAVLTASALLDPAASAQQPDPSRGFDVEVSVGYVLVPVVVRSLQGYVENLEAEDFRLFVDDRPTPISSFDRGRAAPISVIFLQDLSGSMANGHKIGLSRRAIDRFLAVRRQGDLFALASFAHGRTSVDVPFTSETLRLHEAMDSWFPNGTTALHDAVSWLPELTLETASMKRAAVLISDGIDNASHIEPPDARERVRQAELPVYVLALAEGRPEPDFDSPTELAGMVKDLNDLAFATGGRFFWIASKGTVDRASAVIFADLRQQYVLGFSIRSAGDPSYHQIRVELRRPRKKITLSFRRGYEGTLPAVAPDPPM